MLRTTVLLTVLAIPAVCADWPVAVPGFQPVKPGEHPRLLFRASEVPALKAKAKTPDGQRIIAQLKAVLGGGDSMPTSYCTDKPVNSVDEGAINKQPKGTFTLSHGVGYGFLYQITGEAKYADLAKQSVEKIFEGQVDRDSRYNLITPGTGFRLGFVYQSIALTYDFCYQAWPEDYRKSVAARVLTVIPKKVDKGGKPYSLEDLANGGGYPPGSNHYGAYLLGPAMLALGFKGDPGADDARYDKLLGTVEKNMVGQLGGGFGDHGWFAEGTSCGRISANCGILPLLQSLKVAAGKDYITPKPNGRYTVLNLMQQIVPRGGKAQTQHRGDYGSDTLYQRPIISHMGDFSEGMGAVTPAEAEAMSWIYSNFVEPGEQKIYDATVYPHLAVYAFVNWPAKATDPDEVLPKVMVDDIHGYYVARNRWQDGDDVVVTTLLKRGPGGYKGGAVHTGTRVWGFGADFNLGGLSGKTADFKQSADGSMVLSDEKGGSLVVDFSGASGATALVAAIGAKDAPSSGAVAKGTVVTAGGVQVSVVTLGKGEHPAVAADGDKITVGKQVITVTGGKLGLTTFTAK